MTLPSLLCTTTKIMLVSQTGVHAHFCGLALAGHSFDFLTSENNKRVCWPLAVAQDSLMRQYRVRTDAVQSDISGWTKVHITSK